MYSKYTWFNLTPILLLQTYYLTKSRPTSSFRFEHLYFFRSCPKKVDLNIWRDNGVSPPRLCPEVDCDDGSSASCCSPAAEQSRSRSNEEQKGTKLYLSRRKNGKGGNILKINNPLHNIDQRITRYTGWRGTPCQDPRSLTCLFLNSTHPDNT